MARIRTIKPEFFTSEDIVALDPLARLLYIAIWCEADKEGRLAWKPVTFKMRYLPGDMCDINTHCDALVKRGLVILYGDGYAVIPRFREHQHVNPREKDSSIPAPSDEELTRRHACEHSGDKELTSREEGRKEGKVKEGKESLSPESPDKKGKYSFSDADMKVATWIAGKIKAMNPSARQPNLESWANDVRLMCDSDNRNHSQICDLFNWVNKDTFWRTNVMCTSKLREKWDQLVAKRGDAKPQAQGKFQVGNLDHSSTEEAMQATVKKYNLEIPEGDDEISFGPN